MCRASFYRETLARGRLQGIICRGRLRWVICSVSFAGGHVQGIVVQKDVGKGSFVGVRFEMVVCKGSFQRCRLQRVVSRRSYVESPLQGIIYRGSYGGVICVQKKSYCAFGELKMLWNKLKKRPNKCKNIFDTNFCHTYRTNG